MRIRNGIRMLMVAAGLLFAGDLAAQNTATITGRVTDMSGAALSGVQVVVVNQVSGLQNGALTQSDGRYTVSGLRAGGPYTVEARYIGYGLQVVDDVFLEAGATRTVDFRMNQEAIAIDAIEVFASRATERKTPVAFTDVSKVQIQNQLGSRDLPLVLNVTPSVYSTQQGGGAGDARINVRGFSQRNTAVMINGVPVNDMENGWVYWSNWDGLGDASTSVQLQRGLSAVNLATPSIGGTLNVITDPSAMRAGFSYKQEFGSGSFLKETFVGHTGEIDGFALTASVVRKTGDGIFGGGPSPSSFDNNLATWTDAWAYYLASSYQVNSRNRLELYAVGAPQRHGQNLYKLNLGTLDPAFAASLDDYSPEALSAFPEAGPDWSPNVGPVSPSYTGQQYTSTGPGSGTFDRYDPGFINERENYFHKPQVNLNWYSYFGNGLTLSTVAYYSGGAGGGTGTYGSLEWDYRYGQRFADWDATIAENRALAAQGESASGILRNSVNNQWTVGAISKLRKDYESGWTSEIGIDWRTASVDHYREVRDLLGGDYYDDSGSSDFWTGTESQRRLGDRINYDNTNDINWFGAYVQAERATQNGSFYGMFGWARNEYDYTDHFVAGPDGGKLTLSSGALNGFQVKGGVVRNLNDEFSVFGNAGYVSKVPIFDGVIDDVNGVKLEDPQNEKFLSFETGLQYRSNDRGVSFDLNLYHTTWRDRASNRYEENLFGQGEGGLVRLLGVDARHMGIEFEAAYQPNELFRLDAAASLGNWKYLDNVTGSFVTDDQSNTINYDFYIKDLKVGDAPQTQFAYAASFFPTQGAYLRVQGKTFANYWSDYNPFGRTTETTDPIQPWKAPAYTVVDLHGSYRLGDILPAAGDLRVFVNVYNVFDEVYVQDATDDSSFNGFDDDGDDHDADSAEVFLGLPRTFNLGFEISF